MKWYRQPHLHFAVGFEDTFIPQAQLGERPLDEYDLTDHYRHWHSDLALARDVGATMVRWGIPWYRVNPQLDTWEWSWLDRVVDRFTELQLTPIVDLMHYGTPPWLEREFANPAYPEAVAEYAGRVAERYHGLLEVFTPLNEPLLNASYCGEFGYWPPRLSGAAGFVGLVKSISRGIVLTQRAITDAVGDDATFVHVEASFRYVSDTPARSAQLEHLRNRAFLIEDLLFGRVDGDHPLARYLLENGFTDDDLSWAQKNTALPHVVGVNYYPLVSTERIDRDTLHDGGPRDPRPRVNSWTEGLEEVLRTYASRYGLPVFLTETSASGSISERIRWLDDSIRLVRNLRDEGLNIVGYAWWSLIDMMHWSYRDGRLPASNYLLPMGLWSLKLNDATGEWQRERTAAADRYHQHATG